MYPFGLSPQLIPSFKPWLGQLTSHPSQLVLGLSGSARSLALAFLYQEWQGPLVVVTPTLLSAIQLQEDLLAWYPQEEIHVYPAEENLTAEYAFVAPELMSQRVTCLDFLASGRKGIAFIPLAGLRKGLVPVDHWHKSILQLAPGQEIGSIEALLERLLAMGYRREEMVASPGEFAQRGGIVDIYPLDQDYPIRLDFFDTELDGIRSFSAENQRSLESLDQIRLLPATDLPISPKDMLAAGPKVLKAYDKAIKAAKTEDMQAIWQVQRDNLQDHLDQGELPLASRYWYSQLFPKLHSIMDYVAQSAYVVIDDYARILEKDHALEKEAQYWLLSKQESGDLPPTIGLTLEGRNSLKAWQGPRTYFSIFQKGLGRLHFDALHNLQQRSMSQFFSQMPLVKVEVDRWTKQGATVVFLVETNERAKKLHQTLEDFSVSAKLSDGQVIEGVTQILVGSLSHGFELPQDHLALVTERELFNKLSKRPPRAQKLSNAERLKSYTQLAPGDYVVHVNHGVGVYKGMETLEINGVHQDYMSIHYQDGGNLFVPVNQIQYVQKFVSSDAKTPKLNKLGTPDWAKTKKKVASKIEDIADELIELYAQREGQKGYAFSKDTPEQTAFEDAFPYSETQDQLRSVKEIKADMQKARPMDRLLVGDVGYGKTEVAMRAAFKAVMDGKQVAVLVPTTILAEQHYNNFLQRFQDYPITIGLLSRFRTKKQQEETLAGLAKGQVDILIGTHRILSKDVAFLDLGLLIVDEEQRFGVKHKERLKQLKTQVDVLTLTATPIPRTLHMSMLGVRDLSVIETPPANRYPVQTFVIEQDGLTIRDGIEREMARGGQVFYLYNRVDTIDKKADQIRQLVPEARVATVHGQMNESTLESILLRFIEGEFDVLVTTTIIETGVDIPNVNTLFIEGADKMGLSQLYQLRGRVGRTNRIAYAYLMYQPDKVLTEVSEKRLQAMRDFTDLGSGFKIAMRDLSIRGAGNLLGKEQHGFIDSVGFDLYSQMLSQAVARKQGKAVASLEDTVEIDLQVDAYLPADYIQDERQKIEMYKRIKGISSLDSHSELLDDMIDRFGEFPDQVANLLEVGLIRYLASLLGVTTIKRVANTVQILIGEPGASLLKGPAIMQALGATKLPAQITPKGNQLQVGLTIQKFSVDQWLNQLAKFLKAAKELVIHESSSPEQVS